MSTKDRREDEESGRTARGYRVRDFAKREGVDVSTVHRWIDKGAVKASRLAPGTGLRVDYFDPPK